MYEDLINRLRYESQNAIETCDFDFALAWMQEAADAIEELIMIAESYMRSMNAWADTAEKAAEWIPNWVSVSERLPEVPDGEIFSKGVYVTDGTEISKACIMRYYDGTTGWTYTGIGKITHWCEQIKLPEPQASWKPEPPEE